MGQPLRILIVEDIEDDALLEVRQLREAGYEPEHLRVDSPEAMIQAIEQRSWDIVIADYSMPRFSGLDALRIAKGKGRDIPFILVSGTIGEELAVEAMRAGADDYIMKDSLSRLGPAVERELKQAESRRARRCAEQALRKSEEKYRTIIKTALDGMLMLNPNGEISDVNDSYCRMSGYTRQELAGMSIADIEVHENYQDAMKHIAEARKAGSKRFEARHRRKDSTEFPVAVSLSAGQIGDETFFIAIIRDTTEPKQTERRLLDYQARLKSLTAELVLAQERERRRIAVGVHDQIGQKMALAKLETESLMSNVSDTQITASLTKTCRLIEQVVHDAHSLTFELSNPVLYEIGLDAAIESWLDDHITAGSKLKYSVVSDPSPLRPDLKTRIVLFAVVRELLANVAKYAGATRVQVSIRDDNGRITIHVEDDGVGFDVSRLERAVKETGGFGLFHAQERVEYLGGTFTITSAPGKGTRICISIPYEQDVAP